MTVQPILDGIAAAEAAGFQTLKLNAVIIRGINDDAILDLARFARERGHIMRYIEYMDVGTLNDWGPEQVISGAEIAERIGSVYPLDAVEPAYHGEVAARWRYRDGAGEIGLITSVSQPFCGACTRARVSADGRLYTCLFAADGLDLRTPLREGATDEQLLATITSAWRRRADRYSELRSDATTHQPRVEMYQVGG
jgi:cyclic pyranopterin phosphate synthase